VADLRAPTPSAAAELAVPDREELRAALIKIKSKLSRGALTYVELAREKLNGLQRRPVLRKPLEFIYARAQELDEIRAQMSKRISDYLEMRKGELRLGTVKLLALSPLGILRRGFAVVRSEKSGRIIREAKQVAMGEGLNIRLHSGRLGAVVNRRTEESD
jgi:exodeoxyribonuclease VII large subunit